MVALRREPRLPHSRERRWSISLNVPENSVHNTQADLAKFEFALSRMVHVAQTTMSRVATVAKVGREIKTPGE